MNPQRYDVGHRSSLFRRIDENTPIPLKAGVLMTVLLFAVTSTWWASEVKSTFATRIETVRVEGAEAIAAVKADCVQAIAALKARHEAQEDHLRATDASVQELRHGIERIESKIDDVNRYLRSPHP